MLCRLTPLASPLLLGLAVAAWHLPAQAEERRFDIAPGSLDSVLGQFGQQAGVMVAVDSQASRGVHSPGLRGQFAVEQGLAMLLVGTGLQPVQVSSDRYRLIPQAADNGVMELGATSVNATGLGATTEGTGSYTTGVTSTATKMNLSIRETPQSISVITRQFMDDQQLTSMSDVLKQTPGITMSQDGGERFNIYSRGSGLNTYQFDGITTYQENQTRTMPSTLLDMAIYDRVEVVRGATGLMTGAGDPSGVVNVVRKRPTRDFQAYVQGGLGSWNYRRLEADVSGPLTPEGNLRGRLVAAKQTNHTFMDWYKQDKDIAYGALEADVTDTTLLRVSIDHQRYRPTGAQGVPLIYNNGTPTDFSRSTSPGTRWNLDRFETTNYTIGLEQQLAGDWQLKVGTTYMDVDRYALSGAYYSSSNNSNISPDGSAKIDQSDATATQRQRAIDATLQGPFELFGQTHELIFGANYFDYVNRHHSEGTDDAIVDFDTWGNELPKPSSDTFTPVLDYDVDTRQSGYFTAARFNLSDSLHLILGARASNYRYHYYLRSLPDGAPNAYGMTERGVVTPYAGLVYDLTPEQSVYVSYTDIFKPQSARDREGKYLEPVVGKNYETGWKGEFYDGRLNSSVSLYLVERDNVAELDGGAKVPGTRDQEDAYRAVSGAKTKGIDMELAGELATGWNVQAGYSHSRTEDADGQRLTAQLPMDTFRLWNTYQLQGDWQRLTLGGGVNWNSSNSVYFSRYRTRITQDDYAVVNLMARYRFNEHLSSTLNLNNLFDEKYYTGFSGSWGHYGAPRNVMMNLRYDF
ncbi:TonB-dependent siderophore receptor [Pseudomonas oryziphila]|uniref:TonB-dependent siderophore receptor n=1 Tax=Pseudomonas oryziphila TaxID=2894079 RepID=A0ABM7CQ01_9PSED|nr:TonB-dependent receptor [Pseudomonas oryziphila]AZL73490.1 TonB-dependent siderophore receptor [Pseudomonas oryziphila]